MRDSTTEQSSPSPDAALERLQLVTAYFALTTVGCAIATVFVILSIAFPQEGWQWQDHLGGPYRRLVFVTLCSFASARTYWLLRQRRRSGAMLAAICLAAGIINALWAHDFTWSLLIPALGLFLLASAWHRLDVTA